MYQLNKEKQVLGLKSLAGYIERCDMLFTPLVDTAYEVAVEPIAVTIATTDNKLPDVFLEFGGGLFDPTNGILLDSISFKDYISRGWCRLEMYLCTNTPIQSSIADQRPYWNLIDVEHRTDRPHFILSTKMLQEDILPQVLPRISNRVFVELNPTLGGFTCERDQNVVQNVMDQVSVDMSSKEYYEGETKFGRPHGYGTKHYDNGNVYTGRWWHGLRDGNGRGNEGSGRLQYSNGRLYDGEWRHDVRDGVGTYNIGNGDKYVGYFHKDKYHGDGTYTVGDGSYYKGKWFDGKRHDKNGKFVWADGGSYIGGYQNDKRHGYGTAYLKDGITIHKQGYWKNDIFVGSTEDEIPINLRDALTRQASVNYYPNYHCGCALDSYAFPVHYANNNNIKVAVEEFYPFAPLWKSADHTIDYLRNILPYTAQYHHQSKFANDDDTNRRLLLKELGVPPSTKTTKLQVQLLVACVQNDIPTAKHCFDAGASVNGEIVENDFCETNPPIIIASRFGNKRMVQYLLEFGADTTITDKYNLNAIYYAGKECFIPTLELLLGKPAQKFNELDYEQNFGILTNKDLQHLKIAVQAYIEIITNEKRLFYQLKEKYGIGLLCARDSSKIDESVFSTTEGPIGLIPPPSVSAIGDHNDISKPTIIDVTSPVAHGDSITYYIAHAWMDQDASQKLRFLDPYLKEGGDHTFFLDRLCIPQWDSYLKSTMIQFTMHSLLSHCDKMIATATESFFKRYWCMEELLLFVKFNGYGSVWLATEEPSSLSLTKDVELHSIDSRALWLRQLLPDQDIDFGMGGGPAGGVGIFAACPERVGSSYDDPPPQSSLFRVEGSVTSYGGYTTFPPNGNVTYYVESPPAHLHLEPSCLYLEVVRYCFKQWSCNTSMYFQETDCSETADIIIAWGYLSVVNLANTRLIHGQYKITFNGSKSWMMDKSYYCDDDCDGNSKKTTNTFQRVLLHEIGHILGFDHNDQDELSVMSTNYDNSLLLKLSDGDVRAVQQVYM